MLLRDGDESVEIAWNADRVRDKNRARLWADGRFNLRHVNVVDARLAIDEDRHESVLHQRCKRRRKSHRRRDDLVAAPQAVLDLRAEQRGNHEQIRRRAGVDEISRVALEIVAHLRFELLRERSRRQPELEDALDPESHFLVVKDATRVGDFCFTRHKCFRRMGHGMIARNQAQNLFTQFRSGSVGGIHGAAQSNRKHMSYMSYLSHEPPQR